LRAAANGRMARWVSIELVIPARTRSLGSADVRRVLPFSHRRLVGPFIFFDHFGPIMRTPETNFDVRPHPHIGLATVTYLFSGEIMHRDSLGSVQRIRPGDVNWMIAGRGIVHSERTPPELRQTAGLSHGLQSWVALPLEHEESEPRFDHHPGSTIPRIQRNGAALAVVAGTAYGHESPVTTLTPTLYVHAELAPGAALEVDDEHEERAAYVVSGSVTCDDKPFHSGDMLVFRPGAKAFVTASDASTVMLVGGATLAGTRHIEWNFVSSSQERLERAKDDWRNRRFPAIPGDDEEFIPLPGS
jgi:redox-sensitive bicupin YhaK (pirin superfamily)